LRLQRARLLLQRAVVAFEPLFRQIGKGIGVELRAFELQIEQREEIAFFEAALARCIIAVFWRCLSSSFSRSGCS
jgi:hypothetical protein